MISNAVIVGFELTYVFKTPLLVNMGWVALGEFVCVTIVGVILIKALMKNKYFSKLVTFGMSDQALSEQFKNGFIFWAFLSKKLRKSIDKVRVI